MKKKTKVEIKISTLFNRDYISVHFESELELNNKINNLNFPKYYPKGKYWYFRISEALLKELYNAIKHDADFIFDEHLKDKIRGIDKFSKFQKEVINNFNDFLKRNRYAKNTIKLYMSMVKNLFTYINKSEKFVDISNDDIDNYIDDVIVKRNYSISYQRQFASAIKLLAEFRPQFSIDSITIERPKKDKKLPDVLSPEEIILIIQNATNLKHKTIIVLIYSSGLRISEVLGLTLADLNFERMQLKVRMSKGRKDRYVPIAKSSISLINNYMTAYKPKHYLFPSKKLKQYSASSVRQFLKKYTKDAGIKKHVNPHMLRHSYATHLLENGTDIRYIQELLGHAKPETTMIYTHIKRKDLLNIESPLDSLVKKIKYEQEANNKNKNLDI